MCGVVGLIGSPQAAREAFLGLTTLQHRGQDAAGILSFDDNGFHRVANLGLVESVFTRENINLLTGHLAIGHNRYSTVGRGDLNDVQPLLLSFPYGLGMAHNGNLVNMADLAQLLKKKWRRNLLSSSDTEVLINLLAESLAHANSSQTLSDEVELSFDQICVAAKEVFKIVNGSYSVVTLVGEHGLLAFRDPYGLRPLVWGKKAGGHLTSGESHMVASETSALEINGYEVVRHLEPGEVLYIDLHGEVFHRVVLSKERRHCMFEWVYFASPESNIDGIPVYGARIALGDRLAFQVKKELSQRNLEADIIVPVPETSRIAAIAMAEQMQIPYRELLIKNRYIKRTFILDTQEKRRHAVSLKLAPVRSEIKGKRVILVDDSIVRGTTSRKLIELVRQAGAEKVYFVSTCPPIKHPCFYGIDFPNNDELLAHSRSIEEIEKELGADAVIYLDQSKLSEAILDAAISKNPSFKKPCMACLDQQYPTDVQAGIQFAADRKKDKLQIATKGGV